MYSIREGGGDVLNVFVATFRFIVVKSPKPESLCEGLYIEKHRPKRPIYETPLTASHRQEPS
jgi:hypothetical protein